MNQRKVVNTITLIIHILPLIYILLSSFIPGWKISGDGIEWIVFFAIILFLLPFDIFLLRSLKDKTILTVGSYLFLIGSLGFLAGEGALYGLIIVLVSYILILIGLLRD